MFNNLKEKFSSSSWIKFLGNKYFLASLFFIIWILFLDNNSRLDHRLLDKEISELEDNKTYYQEEIKKDKQKIHRLKNANEIEKYAREKYFMKRENEDIYIIEFDGDTIE